MIHFRSPVNLAFLAIGALATAGGFLFIPMTMSLPAHWGLNGTPDASLPRNWALLQTVAIVAAVWGIFWAIDRWGNRERSGASSQAMNLVLTAITGIVVLIQVLVVFVGVGIEIDFVRGVLVAGALVEIALGSAIPTSPSNSIVGLRIPTTTADPANWTATRRLIGVTMVVAGLGLLIAAVLVPVGPVLFVLVAGGWLIPAVVGGLYSFHVAKQVVR